MNNNKLFQQYKSKIESLPDYKGDFYAIEKKDHYLKSFNTWLKMNDDFKYYEYINSNL